MRVFEYVNNKLYVKCSKCWSLKAAEDFPKTNRKYRFWIPSQCKDCRSKSTSVSFKKHHKRVNEYNKQQIKQNTEKYWFNRHSFHMKAYRLAKKIGYPEVCSICWKKNKIHIHHPFYNSFNDRSKIIFCCCKCHNKIHNNEIQVENFIDLTKIPND